MGKTNHLSNTLTAPALGVPSATLTFTMPEQSGTYVFWFFENDGWGLLATSPAVTVEGTSGGGGSVPRVQVSTTTAAAREPVTVVVVNEPANPKD